MPLVRSSSGGHSRLNKRQRKARKARKLSESIPIRDVSLAPQNKHISSLSIASDTVSAILIVVEAKSSKAVETFTEEHKLMLPPPPTILPTLPFKWTKAIAYADRGPPNAEYAKKYAMEAWACRQKTLHGWTLGVKRVTRGRMKLADVCTASNTMKRQAGKVDARYNSGGHDRGKSMHAPYGRTRSR
jgi:hypothetical protein